MNWIKIKETCPQAFKLLIMQSAPPAIKENYGQCELTLDEKTKVTHLGNLVMNLSTPMIYHRRLYDFFDACGIFVNPTFFDAEVIELNDKKELKRQVITDKRKNRHETEFAAFELAFTWLEEKITEQKKLVN